MPSKKTDALIKRIQANEDRNRARRVAKIKRAVMGADLLDHELTAIEAVVFGAYGRTKLR